MGKRILRIIQRQDAIRISGWRNFLFPLGSKDFNRTLEDSLQHEKTAQQFGWKTASSTNFSANTQTTCAGFINTVSGSKTPGRSLGPVSVFPFEHSLYLVSAVIAINEMLLLSGRIIVARFAPLGE